MSHIVMPVRTLAEWGGVHEWTVDASAALRVHGHEVTIIGAGALFAERASAAGARFVEVDWSDIDLAAEAAAEAIDSPDLIFAHAPQGRMLALQLRRRFAVPTHVMVHGAYHDYMYTWGDQVDSFLTASPSLTYFVQHVGKIEPWKCSTVANGVDDAVFDMPLLPLQQKLSSGVGTIVTASRLSKDKVAQMDSVERAFRECTRIYPDVEWEIDVYGDGPMRDAFESRYRRLVAEHGRGRVTMRGWITPAEVPGVLNRSVLAVMAGMGGVRSVASGTLTVGTGARDSLGVQSGNNLRAGIFSNFGDHGCPRFRATPIEDDLRRLLSPDAYEETLERNRVILRRSNSQSVVDGAMLSGLQLV